MSFQTPSGRCSLHLDGLGKLDGYQYSSGVQQFCGIPYARLPKRWTRASLNTSWKDGFHDGTKLGNDCPRPIVEGDDSDDLVPVPPADHFPEAPGVDELTGLVMNIVVPSVPSPSPFPVMVYIHGGSLLYGGANLPIFDAVNLVAHSIAIGMPIVCVNFNYRVGLGGFLAGRAIESELRHDGHAGSGNFGFTDQRVAFEWVQRYIPQLRGDPGRVTAVGESAGSISISNHLLSADPPKFHRAVCMSGQALSIPPWTMQQHEDLFEAVCRYFHIDASLQSALDKLRAIPQQDLANATSEIQGVASGTGNPCLDSWFYNRDPLSIHPTPAWLQAYMLGDTYHEGVIFHLNLLSDDYHTVRDTLLEQIGDASYTDAILEAYSIKPGLPENTFLQRVEHMCGDAVFKIPNYATATVNNALQSANALFLYHFDQRSRLKNVFEGTAYHAHELLYLFGNLDNELNTDERGMARDFATSWISFTHAREPWKKGSTYWKIWGQDSAQNLLTTDEDEETRQYTRMRSMLHMGDGSVWKKWLLGVDSLVNKRANMGKCAALPN